MSIQYARTPSIKLKDVDVFGCKLSVLAILSAEFCQVLGSFSIASSLTLFLRSKLSYKTSQATVSQNIASGFGTIFSLFGGLLSDSYLGRKKSILLGTVVSLLGLICIAVVTIKLDINDGNDVLIFGILFWVGAYINGLGGGAIKANVGPFGAGQVECLVKSEMTNSIDNGLVEVRIEDALQSYWNWFYFIVNVGALIAYTLVAWVCQNKSFSIGYSIPAVTMILVILIYVSRYNKYYVDNASNDSSLVGDFFRITIYSIKNRNNNNNIHWLDVAKIENGGLWNRKIVNDVKSVYSLFIFLVLGIVYWVAYANMGSLYYSQGCQMNYVITSKFEIPIAALNDADTVIILILVPIVDRFLYPCLKRRNINFSMLKRMGVGYFIMILAMITAAIIEMMRKDSAILDTKSDCDKDIHISSLSILWQIPQYFLVGLSESFASITSNEFFAGQAPKSLKSIVYALNIFTWGVGSWVNSLMVLIVNSWKPEWITNNLNDGYLEYYFILSASIVGIDLLIFIYFAKKYKYKLGTNTSSFYIDNEYITINDDNQE